MMNILNKFKSMFMFIYVDHVVSTLMCFTGSPLIFVIGILSHYVLYVQLLLEHHMYLRETTECSIASWIPGRVACKGISIQSSI